MILLTRFLIVCLVVSFAWPIVADPVGDGLVGALGGAGVGALVGGKKGAKTGAIIGGTVGVVNGVQKDKQKQMQAEQNAKAQQQAERKRWQAEQIRRQEASRAKAQAAAAPDPAVTEIQKSLVRLGIDPGPVDGKQGPGTVSAIKKYQEKNGLLTTGMPSQELLKHMLKNGG